MLIKLVFALIVFCAVIETTFSERGYDGRYVQGYTRIKRGKYNPQRYYSRPPGFPKGAYSYTPPPNYMMDDETPYPARPKVSKRPADGLGDEDLQNFVKYLSKNDLDKLLELAGHNRPDQKQEYKNYRPTTDEYKSIYNSIQDVPEKYFPKEDESKIFNALVREIDLDPKFNSQTYKENKGYLDNYVINQKHKEYSTANYVTEHKPNKYANLANYVTDQKPQDYSLANYVIDQKPNEYTDLANYVNNLKLNDLGNYATEPTPKAFYSNNPEPQLDNQESTQQVAYADNQNGDFIDSKLPEENLPKPLNLRDEQDFQVSFTNNVPTFVKADGYKVENFGALPLMNYNSKLDTLSSYHVPHYSVTSSKSSYSSPSSAYSSSSRVPAVEPAPPSSAAKEQSDSHLKAVRIWSHKSKGTAYTLHDDGTLSLERPARPKGTYGYP